MILTEETARALLGYYSENKISYPWRQKRTSYTVWLSEVMLQQTRIQTVIPYYERFIRKYPDIQKLADAKEEEVLKVWEGLGYYSRAKNLRKTAALLVKEGKKELPSSYDEIRKLPGIGDYMAGAVLSIAYRKPYPVVDGNVARVLARLNCLPIASSDPQARKSLQKELTAFYQANSFSYGDLNEALMELGEKICIANQEPKCENCPVKENCKAYLSGTVSQYPLRRPKSKRKIKKLTVLILQKDKKVGLVKRTEGLLNGLYGFPVIEGTKKAKEVRELFFGSKVRKEESKKHIFSHEEWEMTAYRVQLGRPRKRFRKDELIFVTQEELEKEYSMPTAFRKWEIF